MKKQQKGPRLTPNLAARVTMNGMPFDEAEKMVLEFLDHRNSSHPTTSVWFPTAFITQIISAVEKDDINGVRFYFAKDKLKNTVIPVATKEGPEMSHRHQRPVNIDFFDFSESLAYIKPEVDYRDGGLYTMICDGANCAPTSSSIPCSTAVEWAKSFKKDQLDKDEIINTTSVWYHQDFFKRLNHKLSAASKDGIKSDGIRLYFIRNKQHRDGFVFFTTYENGSLHTDNTKCYDLDPMFFVKKLTGGTPDDRGEECPIFCPGTTWSDCEL